MTVSHLPLPKENEKNKVSNDGENSLTPMLHTCL